MNSEASTAEVWRKWILAGQVFAASNLLVVMVTMFCRYRASPVQANLVSISFVGHSTNGVGQHCVEYRVQNGNAENLLALAEFPNSTPGSGLFVPLPMLKSQTILLAEPPAGTPCRIQLSCFIDDRGLLSRVYGFVQSLRGKRPHEITKLLFTVPGPIIEQ
jgi:hypothetical protein